MQNLVDTQVPQENSTAARIASLRKQMKQLSRQIGLARKAGQDTGALIRRMQMCSTEHKELESLLKASATGNVQKLAAVAHAPGQDGLQLARAQSLHPDPARPGTGLRFSEHVAEGEWDTYVRSHPRFSPYHFHCWKKIIEASFSHRAHFLAARHSAGRIVGVLPLVRQKSLLFGDFMTSVPFVNYGGPLGDSAHVERAMMVEAGRIAQAKGCRHVEFRDEMPRPEWPSRTEKVSMRLALPASSERLWEMLSSKLRSQIRRAGREGPRVAIGGQELLPDFYSVFSHHMRDLGTPVYTARFFENVARHARSPWHVVVAYLDGRPVSAGMLIRHGSRVEIPWASTRRSALSLGINMYFYWHVLRFSVESGASEFDFGRSTRDSGTYRFKKQWGAKAVPLYWHYWLPEAGALPGLNPENPKFRVLIDCWRRLPVWAANAIGPPIARSLP